jgi:hypothetical protein
VLTKREKNRLLVFERKILHTIYVPKIIDGVYKSRYNFELDRESNSLNVISVVKSTRLRNAGHTIRVSNDLKRHIDKS